MAPRSRARLAYVALYAAIGADAPYVVLYYQRLGFDLALIGWIFGFGAVVALIAGPAWGALSDRLRGSPAVLILAMLVGLAGTLGLWLSRDLFPVVIAALVLSAGLAGVSPIIDARALETSGPERSGYGPLRAWGSISYIVFSFATGSAIEWWGIGSVFAVLGAGLISAGLVGLTLRAAIPHPATPSLRTAGRLFLRPPLGLFLVGASLTWIGLASVLAFYSLRLTEVGAPASVVGASAALGAAVEVPIMLSFPALAGRFGGERLLVLGAIVFAIRALAAGLIQDPWLLVLNSGFGGIGYACFLIGGVTYVSRHAPPELAATAQGVFQGMTLGLGQVVAGVAGGVLAGVMGLAGLYVAAAGLGVLSTLIVALAVGVHGRPGASIAADPAAEPVARDPSSG
jgi:MFS transporter, PPP family, 3-phenylpropionic acid transporter